MTSDSFTSAFDPSSDRVQPPIIVAELSGNHNQSLQRALDLVEAAAECGVDAVKLQTYTADTITLDIPRKEFVVNSPGSAWHNRTFHSLYHEAHTPWEWHEPIIRKANQLGLLWFSSPFDSTAVEFLESLNPVCYKIASPEIIDLPLIAKCARTLRPMVISTGMATISEINDAVHTARSNGCNKLILLKCTSSYPSSPDNSNLRTIPHMTELFKCSCGLSDHTLGVGVGVAATALGAVMIEKHLTLQRSDGGPDAHFSLEPSEMKTLVEQTRTAHQALGEIQYGPQEVEHASRQARRSLYVACDMAAGESFTNLNLKSVRPGYGLSPKYFGIILGHKVKSFTPAGTPVTWDLIR
jgi:pseudaminic acid synthase